MTEHDELQLREVLHEPDDGGERLQEGVVEVAAVTAAAFTGLQAAGTLAQARYARLTYESQAARAECDRAEFQAGYERIQREFHEQMRMERLAEGGLEALDDFDDSYDEFRGFGVD